MAKKLKKNQKVKKSISKKPVKSGLKFSDLETVKVEKIIEKHQGGKAGMHTGHQYKLECMCARCKRETAKVVREKENTEANENNIKQIKQTAVDEYLKNLPNETVIINLTDEVVSQFEGKIETIMKQPDFQKIVDENKDNKKVLFSTVIERLFNLSIPLYLKTL